MKKSAGFWNKKLFLLSIASVVFLIFTAVILDIYLESGRVETGKADAIVVLGARQIKGQPLPVFKSRLDQAYKLYKSNLAPIIILTGGVGSEESISEAEAGKNYLIAKKVSDSLIITETIGRTTWQSLNNILPIVKEKDIRTVILVSDDFHSKRLKRMADDLSLPALVAPVTDGPIQQNFLIKFRYILRESWVYILYLIFKI